MNKDYLRDKLNELERFKKIKDFVNKSRFGSTYFKIKIMNTPLFSEITNIFLRKFKLDKNEILSILDIKIDLLEKEISEVLDRSDK